MTLAADDGQSWRSPVHRPGLRSVLSDRSTGHQEATGTREMAGDSSSTTVTANPEKRGCLHTLSLAARAERHVDWRSEGGRLRWFRTATRELPGGDLAMRLRSTAKRSRGSAWDSLLFVIRLHVLYPSAPIEESKCENSCWHGIAGHCNRCWRCSSFRSTAGGAQ